jgi:hypothetical protein
VDGSCQTYAQNGGSFEALTSDISDPAYKVDDGNWHYVVGVWASSSDRKIYIDGVLKGDNSAVTISLPSMNRTSVGRYGDSTPSSYAFAHINDASIYDRELTADEILFIYENSAYGTTPAPTVGSGEDYFDVFGVSGIESGYPYLSLFGDIGYSYGYGYEGISSRTSYT